MKGKLGEVIIRDGTRTYKKCYQLERANGFDVETSANLCEEKSVNEYLLGEKEPDAERRTE